MIVYPLVSRYQWILVCLIWDNCLLLKFHCMFVYFLTAVSRNSSLFGTLNYSKQELILTFCLPHQVVTSCLDLFLLHLNQATYFLDRAQIIDFISKLHFSIFLTKYLIFEFKKRYCNVLKMKQSDIKNIFLLFIIELSQFLSHTLPILEINLSFEAVKMVLLYLVTIYFSF